MKITVEYIYYSSQTLILKFLYIWNMMWYTLDI